MNVRGLNTAATLWCSAAVGCCAGTSMIAEATLLTAFVLAGNTLLRPLVNMINRIPIDDRATEATYEVSIISSHEAMPQMRDLLVERLEQAN
ncbi:MgtC/SapB family protein, partial [Escherichia coli]